MLKQIISILISLILASTALAQDGLVREFAFNEYGGKTVGGSAILISHRLRITQAENGELVAHLTSNGFQTSNDIHATVKSQRNRLSLYFDSTGKNHTGPRFKKGELLLRLLLVRRNKYKTVWGAFRPTLEKSGKKRTESYRFSPVSFKNANFTWIKLNFEQDNLAILVPQFFIVEEGWETSPQRKFIADTPYLKLQVSQEATEDPDLAKAFEDSARVETLGKISLVIFNATKLQFSEDFFVRTVFAISEKKTTTFTFTSRRKNQLDDALALIEVNGKPIAKRTYSIKPVREMNSQELRTSKEILDFKKMKSAQTLPSMKFVQAETSACPDNPGVSRLPYELGKNEVDPELRKQIKKKISFCLEIRTDGSVGSMIVTSLGPKELAMKIGEVVVKKRYVPAKKDGKYSTFHKIVAYEPIRYFTQVTNVGSK